MQIFLRNKSFIDIMSLNHLGSGLFIGILFFIFLKKKIKKNFYFIGGSILLIIWELFEISLRFLKKYYPLFLQKMSFIPSNWTLKESYLNIVSDLIVGFIGLFIVYIISKKLLKNKE